MMTLINLASNSEPNFGSGKILRCSILRRRGIANFSVLLSSGLPKTRLQAPHFNEKSCCANAPLLESWLIKFMIN